MLVVVSLLLGCGSPKEAPTPGLTAAQVATRIGPEASDREGWARDLREALIAADLPLDEAHVCAVLAVVEQESGYRADPAIPGLGAIARREIEGGLGLLGPLADNGVDWLLQPVPEGSDQSFDAQLASVRTEQELDRFFRALAEHHARHAQGLPFAGNFLEQQFEKLNPVKTAGSMQVSVAWAQEAAARNGIPAATVRDLLYTRAGGLRWGSARLFTHDADYDDVIHRFADFNAGVFASRNAAFQEQLAAIMGLPLALDGDLRAYRPNGKAEDGETVGALLAWRAMYATDLPERQLRRDIAREKDKRFEDTPTWEAVRASYRERTGKEPAYARVPDVRLSSPKMSKPRTTAWFAKNVVRRYEHCMERDGDA